ncbi:MAG: hypothetical protein KAH56_03275 [Candidatus Krumholzibacteria bacterium]|nr:hypothetical protein [Candidatus Krumholzibacteria bacterium]
MDLAAAKEKLQIAEVVLDVRPLAFFAEFDTPYGELKVTVTERLRRKCRKGRVWKSVAMLTALKNAVYGFDAKAPRSRGGADGIFRVDRNHRPANSMMKKLFDKFLEKSDPLVPLLANELGSPPENWIPVRLVSHHMRLLGVLSISKSTAHLALIDYDNEKSD